MKVFFFGKFINGDIEDPLFNLSNVGYFYRKSFKEFLEFISRKTFKSCESGQRIKVTYEEYLIFVYKNYENNGCVIITDIEYPTRVAFSLTYNNYDEIDMEKIQDPVNFDKITKLNADLQETTNILNLTIEQLLEREGKLDKLVEDSEELSVTSKIFYLEAKKNNSCCVIV